MKQKSKEQNNTGSQPAVRLKGVGDSLYLKIDPSRENSVLREELTTLFERLRHLAINAKVVIDTEQEDVNEDLVRNLGGFLKESFGVSQVLSPPGKRSHAEEKYRKNDLMRSWNQYQSDVLMLTGRVRSGQKVSAKRHLVLLGDVNPGGEVLSGGDIIVIGNLFGSAYAGQPETQDAIILALDFRPTQIQIGNVVAAGPPSTSLGRAEFAHVENDCIVVEDYLKQSPFGKQPWPEVR